MAEEDVLGVLESRSEEVRDRFGVRTLSVFGSVGRGEFSSESDVDVYVEFEGSATFDQFMGLKLFLEDLLDRPVDLVTSKALPPSLRSTVDREGQRVA